MAEKKRITVGLPLRITEAARIGSPTTTSDGRVVHWLDVSIPAQSFRMPIVPPGDGETTYATECVVELTIIEGDLPF